MLSARSVVPAPCIPVPLIAIVFFALLGSGAALLPVASTLAAGADSTKAVPLESAIPAPADTMSPEEKSRQQAETDKRAAEMEGRRHDVLKASDPKEQKIDGLLAQVEKSPDDYDLRYQLANAYHEAGHLHSALLQFGEAIRIDPSKSRASVNRGVVLKELGRTDDAEAAFRQAIAANPEDALAQINLGDVLLTQKKYQPAVDAYRVAIRLDPKYPNAYYSLAIAFAESGLYRDAARAWRKCAELATVAGENADPGTAERALENAKLMDDIIADADKEIRERAAKQKELESGAVKTTAPAGGAKTGG
jgi:tetratricopeptide (TPR) repeat protein